MTRYRYPARARIAQTADLRHHLAIERLVNELYNLSPEEIALVEVDA